MAASCVRGTDAGRVASLRTGIQKLVVLSADLSIGGAPDSSHEVRKLDEIGGGVGTVGCLVEEAVEQAALAL